jgi:predicted RNA-binding Zn-ribbon protein involved in translation (DUF1610 family)
MTKKSAPTYNGDGPECPSCGHVITPDEGHYYDPGQYTEDECPECGTKFTVEVNLSAHWRCEVAT